MALGLQGAVGNRLTGRLLAGALVQPKLTINRPGDRYEQEADRVADEVMRMPEPPSRQASTPVRRSGPETVQRVCSECQEELQRQPEEEEDETLQAKPSSLRITPLVQRQTISEEEDDEEEMAVQRQSLTEDKEDEEELLQAKRAEAQVPTVTSSLAAAVESARQGGGQPLDSATRGFMEARFGHDLSQVRVHTGPRAAAAAQAVSAKAFTTGRDIVFGQGQYTPATAAGQRLLAHELTHAVQQGTQEPPSVGGLSLRRKSQMDNESTSERRTDDEAGDSCRGTAKDGPGIFEVIRSLPTVKAYEIGNFDIAKYFLKSEHKSGIEKQLRDDNIIRLVKEEGWSVFIIGGASTQGSEEYNQSLSELRAICTRLHLLDVGVPAGTMRHEGVGERAARKRLKEEGAPKRDEVEAAIDRRVQIWVVKGKAPKPEETEESEVDCQIEESIFPPTIPGSKLPPETMPAVKVMAGAAGVAAIKTYLKKRGYGFIASQLLSRAGGAVVAFPIAAIFGVTLLSPVNTSDLESMLLEILNTLYGDAKTILRDCLGRELTKEETLELHRWLRKAVWEGYVFSQEEAGKTIPGRTPPSWLFVDEL